MVGDDEGRGERFIFWNATRSSPEVRFDPEVLTTLWGQPWLYGG